MKSRDETTAERLDWIAEEEPRRRPDPQPPGKEREPPIKEPPKPRRGPHEVPDPPPVDDPRPPEPKRSVD